MTFPRENEEEITFLVIDTARHWLRISKHFLKNINVRARQWPD